MLLHVVIIGNVPLYHYKRHSKERAQNPCPTRRVGSFSWHHGTTRVLADGGRPDPYITLASDTSNFLRSIPVSECRSRRSA